MMAKPVSLLPFERRLKTMTNVAVVRLEQFRQDDNHKPLAHLLSVFTGFAVNYWYFLIHADDLASHIPDKNPDPTATTASQHTLNKGVENLQCIWDNISRACEQRLLVSLDGQAIQTQLTYADQLAAAFFHRFTKNLPPDVTEAQGAPIVYFEKLHAISRHLFTPSVLISIPFQFYDDPNQWNALAHELGHHIFWNTFPYDQQRRLNIHMQTIVVRTMMSHFPLWGGLTNTWLRWLEESFADMTGTLMAGELFARSAIDLALGEVRDQKRDTVKTTQNGDKPASSPVHLIREDLEHPSFYLRPMIAIKTLQWLDGGRKTPRVKQLTDEWESQLKSLGCSDARTAAGLSLDNMNRTVEQIVYALLDEGWATFPDNQLTVTSLGDAFDRDDSGVTTVMTSILSTAKIQAQLADAASEFVPEGGSFQELRMYLESRLSEIFDLSPNSKADAPKLLEMLRQTLLDLPLSQDKFQNDPYQPTTNDPYRAVAEAYNPYPPPPPPPSNPWRWW